MPTDRFPVRRAARATLIALVLVGASASLGGLASPSNAGEATPVPPELQKKITEAIEKGEKWVRGQRSGDGMFGSVYINGGAFHELGLASLSSLSLLGPGASKADPGLHETLAALKKRDDLDKASGARTTYGTGILIMFITELYRPEAKPEKPSPYAKAKVKDPCNLPKDMLEWVQDLAGWLVEHQQDEGLWRYPANPPGDLSNTQYALLGLRAARDCGAKVPASCFLKALERVMKAQEKDGKPVKRVVSGGTKPGEFEYAVQGDKARGWGYMAYENAAGDIVTGAMTTAAIAVLAIARDALKSEKFSAFTDKLDRDVARSVQDGFAWLDLNFAVDKNPPPGAPAWHYYYLYGLERACVFGGRDRVGKHDWYVEGAQYLVDHQKADGSWSTGAIGAKEITPSDLCDTAWALLFLRRATRPLIPVNPPVVTSGN